MKILLVDDDAFLRDMYATKFGEKGHAVEVAESGEKALEHLKQGPFDVVLLDVVMPGMTGVELIRAIHDEIKEHTPKCIVLSNQGSDEDLKNAKDAGALGYIVKAEMIPSEVVTKVEEVVSS